MDTTQEYEEINSTRALGRVTGTPWLILESNLWDIINVASRSNLNIEGALAIAEKKQEQRMEAASGERLGGTRSVVVTNDGVAVVPVYDSLFRRADMFSMMSGASSMESIERDFLVALHSKKVKSILLDVDSPGGEVNFTEHLGDTIFNARGMKSIQTLCSGLMCSGALWIGTSSSRSIITRSAMIGSVGVYSAYVSTKKWDEKNGIKRMKIVSSFSPKKVPDPETPEGEAEILKLVNSLADVFASTVARNLDISVEKVKGWQGAVLVGQEAIKAGMAHEIGTFDSVMQQLTSEPSVTSASVNAAFLPAPAVETQPVADETSSETETEDTQEAVEDEPTLVSDDEDKEQPEEEQTDSDKSEPDSLSDTTPQGENTVSKNNDEKRSAWETIGAALGLTPAADANASATSASPAVAAAPVEKSEREKKLEAAALEGFMQSSGSGLLPTCHDPLRELYSAAQDAGIEDKVKAFVESIPSSEYTQDRLPVGQGYLIPKQSAEDEAADIKQAKEDAKAYLAQNGSEEIE